MSVPDLNDDGSSQHKQDHHPAVALDEGMDDESGRNSDSSSSDESYGWSSESSFPEESEETRASALLPTPPSVFRDVEKALSRDMQGEEREHGLRFLALVERIIQNENAGRDGFSDGPPESQEDIADAQSEVESVSDVEFEDLPSHPDSLSQLVESLRMTHEQKIGLDEEIKLRVADFEAAQLERRKRYHFLPHGIVGLFSNLSDIRADLRWAEDAAIRRERHLPFVKWQDFEMKRAQGWKRPYFTYSILSISVIMMLVAFAVNDWKVEPLDVNPLIGPSPETLLKLGALRARTMFETNQWYRLVTPIVLHGGIVHLLLNLTALGLIGGAIERNHGALHAAALFFIPAIGGNVISGVMQPGYILVGASGGIFGLIGVCLADIALNWKLLFLVFQNRSNNKGGCFQRFYCAFWLVFDVVVNSLVGFTPFVDNYAHMGGMLYGFLIALTALQRLPLSFFGEEASEFCHRLRIKILRSAGAVFAALLIMVSMISLFASDGISTPCPSCRYISCIPFPFWKEDRWWECDGCDGVGGDVYRRNESAYFSDLDLFCPNGEEIEIHIEDKRLMHSADVTAALPSICRQYC